MVDTKFLLLRGGLTKKEGSVAKERGRQVMTTQWLDLNLVWASQAFTGHRNELRVLVFLSGESAWEPECRASWTLFISLFLTQRLQSWWWFHIYLMKRLETFGITDTVDAAK